MCPNSRMEQWHNNLVNAAIYLLPFYFYAAALGSVSGWTAFLAMFLATQVLEMN